MKIEEERLIKANYICPHLKMCLSKLKDVFVQIGVAGTFVRKRIENGGRTFDKRQSWNVNYSFQVCAKYHGGETDFIRAEV